MSDRSETGHKPRRLISSPSTTPSSSRSRRPEAVKENIERLSPCGVGDIESAHRHARAEEERQELIHCDVAAYGASSLRPLVHVADRGVQLRLEVVHLMRGVDTGLEERLEDVPLCARLLDHASDKVKEGFAGIVVVESGQPVGVELLEMAAHDGEKKRLLRRKMPVEGPHAESCGPCDVVHPDGDSVGGERLLGDLHDPLAVSQGVRTRAFTAPVPLDNRNCRSVL